MKEKKGHKAGFFIKRTDMEELLYTLPADAFLEKEDWVTIGKGTMNLDNGVDEFVKLTMRALDGIKTIQ